MGNCCSQDHLTPEQRAALRREAEKNRRLGSKLDQANEQEQSVKKLLLLGAGESGKSTLFKQMIKIYGTGYPLEERKAFTSVVYNNTLSAMKTLCKYSEMFPPDLGSHVREDAEESKEIIESLDNDAKINEEIAWHICNLWADKGIQVTYNNRARFQLPDSATFFFERCNTEQEDNYDNEPDGKRPIGNPDYIPTEQDVLRSRVRTTGIVETTFMIEGNTFKMFDVGGQRNERKKWIHCFEDVTSVIFVAAISEYDQQLFEDETKNRDKKDLFKKKIKHVPLTVAFPTYSGKQTFKETTDYLKNLFVSKNKSQDKDVYPHVTCATDSSNVAHIFNSVKKIIIKNALDETTGVLDM